MIYILGGGPTGVSVAHELDKVSGEEFILIEKEKNWWISFNFKLGASWIA